MKIALGTAQLGMPYGIANHQGEPSLDEAIKIIEIARLRGIETIDTAVSYGRSEERLGEIGVDGFEIISKLPAFPDSTRNAKDWVFNSVEASLTRIRQPRLHGLLLHRPNQLLDAVGPSLWDALISLREQGLVNKIGISIYGPAELDVLFGRFDFSIVQSPMNILDRRIFDSGWAESLTEAGVELHGRSIFLQGLLLMARDNRPTYFQRWQNLWDRFDNWVDSSSSTPLELLIGNVTNSKHVSRIVVGVETCSQLVSILDAADKKAFVDSPFTNELDEALINPALWSSLQEVNR